MMASPTQESANSRSSKGTPEARARSFRPPSFMETARQVLSTMELLATPFRAAPSSLPSGQGVQKKSIQIPSSSHTSHEKKRSAKPQSLKASEASQGGGLKSSSMVSANSPSSVGMAELAPKKKGRKTTSVNTNMPSPKAQEIPASAIACKDSLASPLKDSTNSPRFTLPPPPLSQTTAPIVSDKPPEPDNSPSQESPVMFLTIPGSKAASTATHSTPREGQVATESPQFSLLTPIQSTAPARGPFGFGFTVYNTGENRQASQSSSSTLPNPVRQHPHLSPMPGNSAKKKVSFATPLSCTVSSHSPREPRRSDLFSPQGGREGAEGETPLFSPTSILKRSPISVPKNDEHPLFGSSQSFGAAHLADELPSYEEFEALLETNEEGHPCQFAESNVVFPDNFNTGTDATVAKGESSLDKGEEVSNCHLGSGPENIILTDFPSTSN